MSPPTGKESESTQLELQVYSPSLKVDARGPIAVFSNHDQVHGRLMLDSTAHHSGKLTLTVEGSFIRPLPPSSPPAQWRRHIFFSHSEVVSVQEESKFTLRDAFMRRRPSASHISLRSGTERFYPFQVTLPQGLHPGQELPSSVAVSGSSGESSTTTEISYKMVASWEPADGSQTPSFLEVPIILEQEPDFQSADASPLASDPWLEIPLRTERPIALKLAAAIPTASTFSRGSSIPFFVVFATTPKTSSFAREMATDSTIHVVLTRQIVINETPAMILLTPPPSPSSSDDSRPNLFTRVAKATPRPNILRRRADSEVYDKPLPDVPHAGKLCYSECKTLHSQVFIGFPKRPRRKCSEGRKHPTLEEQTSLPDGLMKSQIDLDTDMLPSIDWAGVSVKYYLDISVSVGQDNWRARIPVRIV
ncbi:hypothetical protein BKA70DRAFT_1416056 [Coprinopsis sp. MPI-PUGE-AT-0042]|nr:hypothetical protein BKA70DRAFT_1416056 [Coprinopsis sp. MPI-PUGE-AT-0042]